VIRRGIEGRRHEVQRYHLRDGVAIGVTLWFALGSAAYLAIGIGVGIAIRAGLYNGS
jgi:hypothetical protein